MRRTLCFLAFLVLAGCGGGGGGLEPLPPQTVDLGTVPANQPTSFTFSVANRFEKIATLSELQVEGPFAVDDGQLPVQVAPGENQPIRATFTPPGVGSYAGAVLVQVASGGSEDPQLTLLEVETEQAVLGLATLNVDFGDVLPGASVDRTVTVSNVSVVSTVTLTGATYPHASLAFAETFPIQVPPGTLRDLTLRYEPKGPVNLGLGSGASVQMASNALDGSHDVGVTATTGGQEITDFGTQTFADLDVGGGTVVQATPELTFDVPADAISFLIEGYVAPGTVLGLRLLEGPGGTVFENLALTGAYLWRPGEEVFTVQVPNSDRTEVQLVAGGGQYKARLYRYGGSAATCDVRAIVERRPRAGTDAIGTIDLNVFLADAITPTAATAAGDTRLQSVLTEVDRVISQQGLRIGDIDYYDIADTAYDDVTSAEFGPMLATSSVATESRLNLFFVRTALGGGVLGVAAMLGGPSKNGTQASGVMSLYTSNFSPEFIGLIAAHEIGHFVGLAHTVEQTGSHDDVLDTVECPPNGVDTNTYPDCTTAGGGYLMHWRAVGGETLTDGQGVVIRGHPLVGPRLLPPPPLRAKPAPRAAMPVDPTVSQAWCGTCRRLHSIKGR